MFLKRGRFSDFSHFFTILLEKLGAPRWLKRVEVVKL